MALSLQELEKLESELPKGGKTTIAKKLGVSKQHVSDVFKNRSENFKVIALAIKMRDKRRQLLESLKVDLAK